MRHRVKGRQLSRDSEHRIAMRRNMAQSLFEHGRITTTIPKAKELQGFAEKLITLAKKGDLHSRRRALALMQDRRLVDEDQEFTGGTVLQKLFADVAPKFADRVGGYTRIVKLGTFRIGDGGDLCMLSLVDEETGGTEKPKGTVRKAAGLRRQRAERRFQFAKSVAKAGGGSGTPTRDDNNNGGNDVEPGGTDTSEDPTAGESGSVTEAPESGTESTGESK